MTATGRRACPQNDARRLAAALAEHRHLRSPRVLCQDNNEPLTRQIVQTRVKRASRMAGLQHTGVHVVLRHTFCSHLAMRGAPGRAIQELAGHQDLTMTQRYMHLSPVALDEAIRLLDEPVRRRPAAQDQGCGDMLATGGGPAKTINKTGH
jgi:site-specific recombinase XerD